MLLWDRGIATAKYLINSPKPSTGYTALFQLGRLDLTVEALVIEELRWHSLFTPEELARARKHFERLRIHPEDHPQPSSPTSEPDRQVGLLAELAQAKRPPHQSHLR